MSLDRARTALLAATALGVLALTACGGKDEGSGGTNGQGGTATEATLVLDFIPNAVHTGIYCALGRGYYEEQGIALEVIEPSSTADTLRLIEAERADFGIADGIDLANQIGRGREAKGILALTQRPLGGVIALAESGIDDPGELEGRTVGVTGVPSDAAVLETIVADAGGDPDRVETVTIGFNGVKALLNRRIDAFTGFVVADGAQVEAAGAMTTAFPLDEHGGPAYPGLVAFSTAGRIEADPDLMSAFVEATARGYADTAADPEACLDELLAQNPELEPELQGTQLDGYLPLFAAGEEGYGEFDRGAIEELDAFLLDTALLSESIDPERYGTNEFIAGVTR